MKLSNVFLVLLISTGFVIAQEKKPTPPVKPTDAGGLRPLPEPSESPGRQFDTSPSTDALLSIQPPVPSGSNAPIPGQLPNAAPRLNPGLPPNPTLATPQSQNANQETRLELTGESTLDLPSLSSRDQIPPNENSITITYMSTRPVQYQIRNADGKIETRVKTVHYTVNTAISTDTELDKIELDGDGKRAAVQALTAHRHGKLLQALKDAKTESEKDEAAKRLEENYRAHYASETQYRLDRIAELDKRLEEMRSQVKDRAGAEQQYLEAAMTLAKLHAQGIAAEPPQLKPAGTGTVYPEGNYSAPALQGSLPPSLPQPSLPGSLPNPQYARPSYESR